MAKHGRYRRLRTVSQPGSNLQPFDFSASDDDYERMREIEGKMAAAMSVGLPAGLVFKNPSLSDAMTHSSIPAYDPVDPPKQWKEPSGHRWN
jgi:hypothetical protein